MKEARRRILSYRNVNFPIVSPLASAGFILTFASWLGATGCAPLSAGGDATPLDPPVATSPGLPGNLVNVRDIDPTIAIDLRYASAGNFTGRPLYPPDMPCLAHRDTAEKLRRANTYLKERGYRLKIWDAYRPPAAQRKLFAAMPDGDYVAHPHVSWSRHCYGAAVDVTLAARGGEALAMPSTFDDFSEKAGSFYTGNDETIRDRLLLLQDAMVKAGFEAFIHEWWHFNDMTAEKISLIHAADLGIELPD